MAEINVWIPYICLFKPHWSLLFWERLRRQRLTFNHSLSESTAYEAPGVEQIILEFRSLVSPGNDYYVILDS